jgi:hypothetical protein
MEIHVVSKTRKGIIFRSALSESGDNSQKQQKISLGTHHICNSVALIPGDYIKEIKELRKKKLRLIQFLFCGQGVLRT